MEREDLKKVAQTIYLRKEQILKSNISKDEQEFNRIFLWLMSAMLAKAENNFPPEGKVIRKFTVTEDGSYVVISSFGLNDKLISYPAMTKERFKQIIIECLEFIENLDHYEILNRTPSNSKNEIDDFMIVIKYSNY